MLTDGAKYAIPRPTIRGRYRDTIWQSGRPVFDGDWSHNTIVDSAWPLIAGLLKNQPRWHGIRFWAVGEGRPEWDNAHVGAYPGTERLENEVHRQAIAPEDIVYLDEKGAEAPGPTTQIEICADFAGQDQILREFGLFGGNASKTRNSGRLINYVIHPRIKLESGATLTRRLRLSLRPDVSAEWLGIPNHWLGASPVTALDGIGTAYAAALAAVGIETVADLAAVEPLTLDADLPLMKLVESRVKSRLTLRTAANLSAIAGLFDRSLWEVIVTPTATLAVEGGASEAAVERLREQVSALQLTLDNRFLRRVTIGELAQPL